MRFEDLDNKIREAAEQHHPPYDEKAWRKMEKLLNLHLPIEKDDRRRILLFLLLLLLVGGGGFLMISQPWNKKVGAENSVVQNAKNVDQSNKKPTSGNETDHNEIKVKANQLPDRHNITVPATIGRTATLNPEQEQSYKDQKNKVRKSPVQGHRESKNNSVASTNESPVTDVNKNSIAVEKDKITPQQKQEMNLDTKSNDEAAGATSQEINKQLSENTKDVTTTATKPSPKKTTRPLNNNGFSFSVSAGPDVSKAGSSKTGKTTIVYGAGVGYTLNRFTLRTGLYVAKKIYWANANDYKLEYTPPPNVKFVGADANCDVLEIPVKLNYNFGANGKGSWFTSAGLSSYLMKKEKYVYLYKTATGSPTYRSEKRNENKHYFSVLDLSGGYSRQLNKTLSVTAEPYVEIPLTGIGAGKVHLQSGGVLFTLGVRPPFRK